MQCQGARARVHESGRVKALCTVTPVRDTQGGGQARPKSHFEMVDLEMLRAGVYPCIIRSSYIYVYIYIYMFMYIYIYIYIYMCVCVYTYIDTDINIDRYIYIYVSIYIHIYVYIYISNPHRNCPAQRVKKKVLRIGGGTC